VRAKADRRGRLVQPGVTRRLLTNGIAAVLAVAAAGFAADLGAEDLPQGEEPQELPKDPPPGGDAVVMMGAMIAVESDPLVAHSDGITVEADPVAFRLIATGEDGKEVWRLELTSVGMPTDAEHAPSSLTLADRAVIVHCGDRNISVAVADGQVLSR
jgi:hypothetical protein